MILKLNEEQMKKVHEWMSSVREKYQEETVIEMQSELFELLVGMPTIYKDQNKTDVEQWFVDSGLYAELKKAKNKHLRNQRYQEKKGE